MRQCCHVSLKISRCIYMAFALELKEKHLGGSQQSALKQ